MKLDIIQLDKPNWSESWIPLSYLTRNRITGITRITGFKDLNIDITKSFSLVWSEPETMELYGMSRAYYLSKTKLILGDFWLNPKFRGKVNRNGQKYSHLFLQTVIMSMIKQVPSVKTITLMVASDNNSAQKLYLQYGFTVKRQVSCQPLHINNGYLMVFIRK